MRLSMDFRKSMGTFGLDIDLDYEFRGILGILGRSGCGKSLTLKSIAGLLKPDSGYIILDGETLYDSQRKVNLSPQNRRTGYMFQSFALFPNMTVEENIKAGMFDLNESEKQHLFSELIDITGLNGVLRQYPLQLSNGQKQRTALARMIGNRPRIVLLDEPFSSIDEYLKEKLIYEVKSILDHYSISGILVSHNRDEIYKICSDTAIMENGSVLTAKPTAELFRDPEYLEASLLTGCKNNAPAIKTGEYKVYVPLWGIELETESRVSDDLKYIGIRAHFFSSECKENRKRICVTGELKDTFERIVCIRFEDQDRNAPDIWWKQPKNEDMVDIHDEYIGIPKNRIMLLK